MASSVAYLNSTSGLNTASSPSASFAIASWLISSQILA